MPPSVLQLGAASALLFLALGSPTLFPPITPPLTAEAPHLLARGAYTYEVPVGSLGDHLLAYTRARWLSYRHQIPLIVRSFPFSDQLQLSLENLLPEQISRISWEKRRPLTGDPLLKLPSPGEILEVNWFSEDLDEAAARTPWAPYFTVDWHDLSFLQELRSSIRPLACLPEPPLPEERLCIAVHWHRTPPGLFAQSHPDLVSASYYQKELQRLVKRASGRPLYIHLFTDDPYPLELLDQLKGSVEWCGNSIEWGSRRAEVPASHRVLADLFLMARFDVLIRSHSNYALVAARIGDVALEISPSNLSGTLTGGVHGPASGQWKVKPGISLDSLFSGWRVRWAGYSPSSHAAQPGRPGRVSGNL